MGLFDQRFVSPTEQKKEKLLEASAQKQEKLDPIQAYFNRESFYDADDFEGQRVTYENGQGKTFDAFEIGGYGLSPDTERGRKKFDKQAVSAASLLGKDVEDVTREDIFGLGEQAKEQAYLEAMKGYVNVPPEGMLDIDQVSPFEGPMAPVINVRQHGIDPYSDPNDPRKLVETTSAYTGQNLLDALNRPDVNAAFASRFNREGARAFDETPAGKEAILEKTDRTNQEIIGDITAGLAKFGVNTGAAMYGISDVAARTLMEPINALASQIDKVLPEALKSGKTLGQDNIASNFARTNKIIDDVLLSDQTKLSQRKLGAQLEEFNKGSEERKAKWVKDKKLTSIGAEVVDLALGVMEGAEAGIENPLALSDILVTSAPQLLTGGIFGKAAVSKVLSAKTANMGTKEAAEYVASKQGKAVIDKVATRTGIATEAVQESMINAVHKQGEVMDYTHDYLMGTSELYQSNIADGMDQYAAKLDVANSVFNTTAAITAVISSGASKFTGTGKATGKMFIQDGPVSSNLAKNLLLKTTKTGTKVLGEGVQEAIQEGGTEFAANVATKAFVDPDQKLLEGVGTSAGLGALAGVATAGAIQGTADVVKGVKASTEGAKVAAGKVKEKVKETAKGYVEDKEDKVIVDPKAEGYDAQAAFDVTLKKGTRDTDAVTHKADVITHHQELMNDIGKEIEKVNLKLKDAPADPNLAVEKKNLETRRTDSIKQVQKEMQLIANQIANESVVQTITKPKEATEAQVSETNKAILSSDRFGSEDLDRIIATKDMPAKIVESAKIRKAFNEVESKISTKDVQSEILYDTGKNVKRSVIDFKKEFDAALVSGDKEKARSLYKEMSAWNKYHAEKLTKLENTPAGETATYGNKDQYSFKHRKGKVGEMAYNKLLANVKLESAYMDKYLALMGKRGQEQFGKDAPTTVEAPAPELDIENLEFGVTEQDIIADLEFEVPAKAPVEPVTEPKPEVDIIVAPVIEDVVEKAPAETLSPIPKAKTEDIVLPTKEGEKPSVPTKEKEPEKVEPTTVIEGKYADFTQQDNFDYANDSINLGQFIDSKGIINPDMIKKDLSELSGNKKVLRRIIKEEFDLWHEHDLDTVEGKKDYDEELNILFEAAELVKPADNFTEKVKIIQERLNALSNVRECL